METFSNEKTKLYHNGDKYLLIVNNNHSKKI